MSDSKQRVVRDIKEMLEEEGIGNESLLSVVCEPLDRLPLKSLKNLEIIIKELIKRHDDALNQLDQHDPTDQRQSAQKSFLSEAEAFRDFMSEVANMRPAGTTLYASEATTTIKFSDGSTIDYQTPTE